MKPTLRKTLTALPLAVACAALGSAAQAQTLNISGAVKDMSCTATISGGNTLNLPVAEPSDLPSAGSIAHRTVFTIALTACGADANGSTARAMFYNTTASAVSNGRLNPTFTPTTAGGWQYMILASNTGNTTVPVRTSSAIVTQTNDPGVVIASNAANLRYRIAYRRNDSGNLSPGTGTASVNYVLYYM